MSTPHEHLFSVLLAREADATAIKANMSAMHYGSNVSYEVYERTERTTTIPRVRVYNVDDELLRLRKLRTLLGLHTLEERTCVSCGKIGSSYWACPTIELLAESEGWER